MSQELEIFAPELDMDIDPGIREAVLILRQGGIETFESCQGGTGHACPDPMVRFHGNSYEGFKDKSKGQRTTRDFQTLGLLNCVVCGKVITAKIKKGKYIYYHCANMKCEQRSKNVWSGRNSNSRLAIHQ